MNTSGIKSCLFVLGWSVLSFTVSAAEPARPEVCGDDGQQGALVICQLNPGDTLWFDGQKVAVARDGLTVFGVGRDQAEGMLIIASGKGKRLEKQLKFAPRVYRIEKVNGLPPKTVTMPDAWKARRKTETGRVKAARARVTGEQYWRTGFMRPAEGRISGVYGSQRILNGKPRSPHYGLDIAADVGTPVSAPAGGTVRLAAADFLLEGGIVIIDHGHGVTSTLFHMDSVTVKEGDTVEAGAQIGTIGAKGRASGPHVDWRINWRHVRLDPGLAIGLQE